MHRLPTDRNVSQYASDFGLFSYGLTNGRMGNIPTRSVGGYGNDGPPVPSLGNIYHVGGLGLDPPNQASHTTVQSPAMPEYDYYDTFRMGSGFPMLVYKHSSDAYTADDIRVDLCHMNFRLEEAAIEHDKYMNFNISGITRPSKKARIFDDPNDHTNNDGTFSVRRDIWGGNAGLSDGIWCKYPWDKTRATPLYNPLDSASPLGGVLGKWITNYGDISTDFTRKWKLSGLTVTIVDDQISSNINEINDFRAASDISRAIVLCTAGDCEVKNLFSPRLSKGDRLYFILAPTQISQLGRYAVKPDGDPAHFECAQGGECIQLRGISTADEFDELSVRTSMDPERVQSRVAAAQENFVGSCGNEPFACERSLDIDYERRDTILKVEGYILDTDENGYARIRDTDDIEDLPPTVMDIYSMGHVINVGIVTYPNGNSVDRSTIARAHRDLKVQKDLPTVKIIQTSV